MIPIYSLSDIPFHDWMRHDLLGTRIQCSLFHALPEVLNLFLTQPPVPSVGVTLQHGPVLLEATHLLQLGIYWVKVIVIYLQEFGRVLLYQEGTNLKDFSHQIMCLGSGSRTI